MLYDEETNHNDVSDNMPVIRNLSNLNDHTSDPTIVICGKETGITRPQMYAIILLSLFFFLTSSFYSIFAPFYPGVATAKGMSETQIGIIFGIFQFTLLVLSPIFGKYVIFLVKHDFQILY